MLSKWQASIMLVVGAVFAGFEIWGFVSPVSREVVETLVIAVFALLAVLFPSVKLYQAIKHDVTKEKIQGLK